MVVREVSTVHVGGSEGGEEVGVREVVDGDVDT